MKIINTKWVLSIISLVSHIANAQQDPMFTRYMENTLAQNPAYAGSRDALTITGLFRAQWVGFDGAPVTQAFTAHLPILNKNIGLGVSVLNDKIGPIKNTSLSMDFAYILKTGIKSKLAFGLKGTAHYINADLSTLQTDQQGDPAFQSGNTSILLPNAGFGLYYRREKFYAGISSPKLIQQSYKKESLNITNIKRHYFLIAGKVFTLSNNLDLKATTFVKMTPGAPIQGDLTTIFIINKVLLLGAGYRSGDSFAAIFGVNISPQLHLGYSFDWSYLNKTFKYNSGSHELMLRYDFIFSEMKKVRSPRYF